MGCNCRESNPGGDCGVAAQEWVTPDEFYIIAGQRSSSELHAWLGAAPFDYEYNPYICATSQLSVGGYVISARGSGDDNYHGDRTVGYGQNIIAEVIVYGEALSEAQRNSVNVI